LAAHFDPTLERVHGVLNGFFWSFTVRNAVWQVWKVDLVSAPFFCTEWSDFNRNFYPEVVAKPLEVSDCPILLVISRLVEQFLSFGHRKTILQAKLFLACVHQQSPEAHYNASINGGNMKKWLMTFITLFFGIVLAQYNPDIARIQMQMVLAGHPGGGVNDVALSPKGQLMATGGSDGRIILWSIASGQQIRKFEGHSEFVSSVSFSPNGRTLATTSGDGSAKIWDVSTGQSLRTFSGKINFTSGVSFSPDGRYVATATDSGTAQLWDVSSGKVVRNLIGHRREVRSMSFSPNGLVLATGGYDNTIKLWDLSNGKVIKNLVGHSRELWSVKFSPNGQILASGSADNTAKLWDVSTGKVVKTLIGHQGEVRSVFFSPDGQALITGSEDNSAKLWNVSSGKVTKTFVNQSSVIRKAAFSSNGKTAITWGVFDTIEIWDIASGKIIKTFSGHLNKIYRLTFSHDGKLLATVANTVRIWDVLSGKLLNTVPGKQTASFSPDGRTLATVGFDDSAQIWDITTGKVVKRFNSQSMAVTYVLLSPNGRYLAAGHEDGAIKLWDVLSGKEIASLSPDQEIDGVVSVGGNLIPRITGLSFSPDGRFLVIIADFGTPRIWEFFNGVIFRPSSTDFHTAQSVSFSFDGRNIAIAQRNTVKILNILSGSVIKELLGHLDTVNGVSFSPDDQILITGSLDNTVRLWDFKSGKEIKRLYGHSGEVFNVQISPDGTRIATASIDTARIYATPEIRPVLNILGRLDISAPPNATISINNQSGSSTQALLPGLYAVTVTLDGFKPFTQTVTIYANQTSSVTATLEPLTATVPSVSSPSQSDRIQQIGALLRDQKISDAQFDTLVKLIRSNQEPDALRRFLNGEITEAQFLERLRAGAIAGVPAQ
jgi:WD40 repeat protein